MLDTNVLAALEKEAAFTKRLESNYVTMELEKLTDAIELLKLYQQQLIMLTDENLRLIQKLERNEAITAKKFAKELKNRFSPYGYYTSPHIFKIANEIAREMGAK